MPLPRLNMNFDPKKLLADPWPLMAGWLLGGLLAILIPLRKWNKARDEYYSYYGYAVEYEQQQRAYEEQQNNDDNNNNNGYYTYPSCHWWQWKCRQTQFMYRQNADGNNNNNGEYQLQYPGWWVFLGGQTEEDQRWAEEQGMESNAGSSPATKFVYAWTIVMFLSILFYGGFVFYKQRPVGPLLIMLIMFLQFSVLAMVLLCQGVLMTDERDLEDSVYGWFGQIGVLMVYTNYAYLWFTFIFTVVLLARAFWKRHAKKEGVEEEANKSDYYEAPEGTMT